MTPGANRVAKYTDKYVAATISLKVAAMLSGMKTGYADVAASIAAVETSIQVLLNGLTPAVSPILYPFYLAFGRQLWAKQRKGIQGTALVAEGTALKAAWVARGLTSATLISIADEVFGITIT